MLIEYSAKNFMSINDIVTFSFQASKIEDNRESVRDINNIELLTASVIYGANASGKSNILNILNYIKLIINLSSRVQKGDKLPYKPFRLNKETRAQCSYFQIVFIVKDIKYTYGFSLNEDKIIDEYLYYYPQGRRNIIFERENTTKFRFTSDKQELNTLAKRTLDNRLFLAVSSEWKYERCIVPFEWLKNDLIVNTNLDVPNWYDYSAMQIINSTELGRKMTKFIKMADPSINNLQGIEEKVQRGRLPPDMPEKLKELFMDGESKRLTVKTLHSDGVNDIEFDLTEESAGTQRFFELLGPFIDIILNGKTLIIDELDLRLHTLLTRTLILLFQIKKLNRNDSQILFTTHDTNLLDLGLFRRDQIWFTEKTKSNESKIYSLIELKKIRKDENTEKGYLYGKYGALPQDLNDYLQEVYN